MIMTAIEVRLITHRQCERTESEGTRPGAVSWLSRSNSASLHLFTSSQSLVPAIHLSTNTPPQLIMDLFSHSICLLSLAQSQILSFILTFFFPFVFFFSPTPSSSRLSYHTHGKRQRLSSVYVCVTVCVEAGETENISVEPVQGDERGGTGRDQILIDIEHTLSVTGTLHLTQLCPFHTLVPVRGLV